MKKKRILSILIGLIQILYLMPISVFAQVNFENRESKLVMDESTNGAVELGLSYLKTAQKEDGIWKENKKLADVDIVDMLEYIESEEYENESLIEISEKSTDCFYSENLLNVDDVSKYLLINVLRDEGLIGYFKDAQNPDGGFGLDKNYASDIVDTKLALKTLEDLGETEAMLRAARYIVSLQNEDGGFGYQPGLESNPELTAEIADILADCVRTDGSLADELSNNVNRIDEYLRNNTIPVEQLSEDNLSAVYRHFHTASFKLKLDGKYDVTPYYALQAEDGGVFDDPMATALFLELIVREQNAVAARMDYLMLTDDAGYTVSTFNKDENVNIEVGSEYESEKAALKITVETPGGENILISPEKMVWNTGSSEEGIYTVKAELIRKDNNATLVSRVKSFRIAHELAVDGIALGLSQSFARVGENTSVDINADVSLRNFTEERNNLRICWRVKLDDEAIQEAEKEVTEAELGEGAIRLGEFTPDTADKKVYLITAEILSDDLTLAQTTTNFFVSDKSVAVVRSTNKKYLCETEDEMIRSLFPNMGTR